MIKKVDFDERKRELMRQIAEMQSQYNVVIDPLAVWLVKDREKYNDELAKCGDDSEAIERINAEHEEAYLNFLDSVDQHYPFEFIMELNALYNKYSPKFNAEFYKAAVEAGQKTSG